MAFSTVTIHMATVDGAKFMQELNDEEMQTDKLASFKDTLFEYIKQAPFNLPTILFKTGTLAVIFSTLKYGGITHGIALVVLPLIVGLIIWAVKEGDITCTFIMGFLFFGSVFLFVNTFTTFMPKKALTTIDDLPFGGPVGCFRI